MRNTGSVPAGRRLRGAAIVVALATMLSGCSGGGADGKTEVVVAFYPLAFVVQEVGGASVTIHNLTPPGVEPHDLELSPGQVRDLSEASLVVYLGSGFQPAVDDAVAQLDDAKVMDALAGQSLLTPQEEASSGITETIGDTETESVDPHVWLDPTRMISITAAVTDRLSEIDPDNANAYESRGAELETGLKDLDEAFAKGLANCKSREIVTSHAAFGYLADRYDLTQISVAGLDPESEPAPGRLAAIARLVEERGITTIFSEELAPPDIADTLSSETGAEIKVLSPLESAPASGDYFSAMETNLQRLREALGCE